MSNLFRPTPFADLARWVLTELGERGSIFDIDRSLFFSPSPDDPFRTTLQGTTIATPFGVAAGPHTQLATGIVASWLCGARVLELKTVQRRGVEVVRPCIRMRDEGLNVEWSQELEPEDSFDQYLDAWVLIHALARKLGFAGPDPETIFDVSVGYDLEGLLSEPMRRYFALVADAGSKLDRRLEILSDLDPELSDLEVPRRLGSRVTLSTLHGCPSDEIGRMITHLIEEYGLDAKVKLNPSLLGAEFVRHVLHDRLGFSDLEPDEAAFADDLGIDEAVDLIAELQATAERAGVTFGVKLSNTLPLVHRGDAFPESEQTMYLSSRPLHPLTVGIAAELRRRCGAGPAISFCGGADAFNAPELLACGFEPVTTCSDLLRPGGIPRLRQYTETTREAMAGTADLEEFIVAKARAGGWTGGDRTEAALFNLERYADAVLEDSAYLRETFHRPGIHSTRVLGPFDCIEAPCVAACGVDQQVPAYLRAVAAGRPGEAADIIRRDNPLPVILGRTCHHPCETECLRTHVDEPLAIRDIKRFAMEHGSGTATGDRPDRSAGPPVAVIGGGPCGLAVAWELRRSGVAVTVFEAGERIGGMVTATIPVYRAADEAVALDLEALEASGVEIRYGQRFGRDVDLETLRNEGFGPIVLATGAPRGRRLGVKGEDATGVFDGLEFLRRARTGGFEDRERTEEIGRRVGVIGAGDVAMDCARTAVRLGAEVEVIYRRQAIHSPAHPEEMRALAEEGVAFRELRAPLRIEASDGRLEALVCSVMRPGAPGADTRPRPVPDGDRTERIELDTLIVAIGQDPETFGIDGLRSRRGGWVDADPETGRTAVGGLWAGGDVVRGPTSIVAAAGDGRRIARDILRSIGRAPVSPGADRRCPDHAELIRLIGRRAERAHRRPTPELPPERREGFVEVVQTLDDEAARAEAARCLDCDRLCSTCVTVCPNRAFLTYEVEPFTVVWPDGAGVFERSIDQPYQVAVINDWCNACGNCTEFCPTAGRPHEDKPRIVLDATAFETFEGNAFHPRVRNGRFELLARTGEATHRMEWGDRLRYAGPTFSAELERETLEVLSMEPASGDRTPRWSTCLALIALGRGLQRSAPGLVAAQSGE